MSQTYSITIFTDTRILSSSNPGSSPRWVPHGFIGFNASGKAPEYFGFAPASGSTPLGPGAVTSQVDSQGNLHEWDFAYTIQVSEAQFNAMYNQHLALQASQPTYVFPAYDCVSGYVRDVLYAGYKADPSNGGQLLGISTVLSVPVLGGIPYYGDLLLRTYADLGFGQGTTKASELPGYGQDTGIIFADARTNYGIEAGKQPVPVLEPKGSASNIFLRNNHAPSPTH